MEQLWLLLATILVLGMQGGFLLLEAGRVRAKNSVSVAQKNVGDLVVSWTAFFLFGYWLMFGVTGPLLPSFPETDTLDFLFQLGFCATAASIVSGGVAERMRFVAYLVLVGLMAAVIYPLVGRWVWGGLGAGAGGSWLAGLGFVDFAGSTVVHGVGAWVALAGMLAIGPRLGRFDAQGRVQPIGGHSAVFSLLGLLVLFIGWFGFNGGALSPDDPRFAPTLLATATSAAFGALAGMLVGAALDHGLFNPSRMLCGMLGALVTITACADVASSREAMVLGLAGGLLATLGAHWLLHRWRLDDPLDVVATHGLTGVLGTLAVAFVGDASALPAGSRLAQAGVQLTGVVVVFAFTFLLSGLALWALSRRMPLRVSARQERLGLNQTEHGEALGTERLQRALDERLDEASDGGTPAGTARLAEDTGDDAAGLAAAVNELLDRQERASAEIRASKERFEQFALTASDWLWESDERLCLSYVSTNDPRVDAAVLVGRPLSALLRLSDAERSRVHGAIEAREALPPCEGTLILDEGDLRIVELRGVPRHDPAGNYLGYRGTFHDVTERHGAERRALFLARHDALTGLSNRLALSEDMAALLASEPGRGTTIVACIDLDGFKAVNDGHGHAVGDLLLKDVAGRLRQSLRSTDRVFRTGGDEFVVLLALQDAREPRALGRAWSEHLVASLSEPYPVLNHSLTIGASVGLAFHPEHGHDPDALVHLADLALYAAKNAGKGRVTLFEPWMDNDARRQVELEAHLREALANEQLTLQYQPQFDGASDRPNGFEALLRWTHPELGSVPPELFIPVAERLGLMEEIGLFVLRTACAFAASWPSADGDEAPSIAVNVSPTQFENPRFVGQVVDVLAESALPAPRLELEITEEVLVRDFAGLRDMLLELRELGVSIAVDDFGSGQTSLSYLNHLPISKLKIDRTLIDGLNEDDRAREITRSIVDLGHKLGCRIIAEGVEEKEQATLLRTWKCDQMQGHLYARPMSAERVEQTLGRAALGQPPSRAA